MIKINFFNVILPFQSSFLNFSLTCRIHFLSKDQKINYQNPYQTSTKCLPNLIFTIPSVISKILFSKNHPKNWHHNPTIIGQTSWSLISFVWKSLLTHIAVFELNYLILTYFSSWFRLSFCISNKTPSLDLKIYVISSSVHRNFES